MTNVFHDSHIKTRVTCVWWFVTSWANTNQFQHISVETLYTTFHPQIHVELKAVHLHVLLILAAPFSQKDWWWWWWSWWPPDEQSSFLPQDVKLLNSFSALHENCFNFTTRLTCFRTSLKFLVLRLSAGGKNQTPIFSQCKKNSLRIKATLHWNIQTQ